MPGRADALTPDLIGRLKAHKNELLAILRDDPVTLETRRQVYAQMVERVNAAYQGGPIDWPRLGMIDPTLDAISKESQRSIESHLADYESKLRAANRTDQHIVSTTNFIRWIAEYVGFKTAADRTADRVNCYAGKLRNEGRAARTIQAHLTAIKGFTKWLTEHHKLPRDPLTSVKKPNPKADRRRERRMFLPEEWRRLETVTSTRPERYGMTGDERFLLYQTAIQTGLRSNELRSLTRGRLYFDAVPPYITCKKVVQTVMRHQSITLTMDTYGHLFPGQEADAVGRLREMLVAPPEALSATGTDNAPADTPKKCSARRNAHNAKCSKRVRLGAVNEPSQRRKRKRPSPYSLRT